VSRRILDAAIAGIALTALLIAVLAHSAVRRLEARSPTTIAAIAALQLERETLLRSLRDAKFREGETGPLEAYLIRIRRDGVTRQAPMKQQLDAFAADTAALLALVDVYVPSARTEGFRVQAPRFRANAVAWQDRWNSLMELFMSGGHYPVAEVGDPQGWASAVASEVQASQ